MNSTVGTVIAGIVNATTKCTKHLKNSNNNTIMNHDMHSAHNHEMHSHSMASGSSMHSGHNLHDGMVMSFHGGYNEVILFDFWQTDSISLFIVSCIILFVMAALYEGLKLLREKLIRIEIVKRQQLELLRTNATISTCHCKHNLKNESENKNLLNAETPNANDDLLTAESQKHDCCKNKYINNQKNSNDQYALEDEKLIVFKSYSSRLLSKGHLIQTLMHMLQITVSYLLMLVFMTYNTWLCLSVVLGAGLGYFLFGLKRLSSIDVNEHCH